MKYYVIEDNRILAVRDNNFLYYYDKEYETPRDKYYFDSLEEAESIRSLSIFSMNWKILTEDEWLVHSIIE